MTPSNRNPNSSLRVVVVNDDVTQLNVLCGLLRKAGLNPIAYTSAETALAAMRQDAPPALIVTDLYMPGLDGWRFCRLLRSPEYASLNPVPVLVVSATYFGEEATRLAHDLGANAFLPMPVDGQKFIKQARTLLRGEKPQAVLKALIVEAGKLIPKRLPDAFLAHGYQVDAACTYQDSLNLIGQSAYDLAVLDYQLPDGQGDGLLKILQEKSPDCVCIMITADPRPELALTWMKMGAAACLPKPFEPEYLIALCERARRERALLRVQDLLERRTRELRESEAKYRLIADTMADTISVIDLPTLRFTYISPSIVRLRGFTVDEAMGVSLEQVLTPVSMQLVSQTLNEEMELEAGGTADPDRNRVLELEEYRKDGSTLWIENTITFLRDDKRQPVALLVLSHDITERRKAQNALRASEERFRQAMAATSDGLWDRDVPSGNVYYSPSYWHMLGYEAREFENKPRAWESLLHPDELERALAVNQQCIENQRQAFEVEFRMRAKNGAWKWILSRGQATLRDAQGRALRMSGTHIDITERKNIEVALLFLAQHGWVAAGEDFFNALARFLAENLGLDYVCIDRLTGDRLSAQTVSIYFDGKFEDNVVYTLKDTPCGDVVGKTICCFPREVRRLFPQDVVLQEMLAESYVGTTLWSSTGQPIGLIAVIGRQPLANPQLAETVLKLVAGRAAGELEHRQAETALRAALVKYQTLFDSFPLGITVSDQMGQIVESNRMAEKLLGVPQAEQSQRGIDSPEWKLVRPDGTPMPAEEYASTRALKEKCRVENVEMGIVKAEGEVTWLSVTAAPVEEYGVVVTYGDITVRKQAEDALRTSEDRFRSIFENVPIGMFQSTPEGKFIYVNPALSNMLGYTSPAELIQTVNQTSIADALYEDPTRRPLLVQQVEQALGNWKIFENRYRRKHGRIIDAILSFGERTDPVTGQRFLYGFVQDITERKQLEAALENRLIALTRPLDQPESIEFKDLFDLESIQHLQDDFSTATGVASIITNLEGAPITRPSNFCRLCNEIIRKTEKGQINCFKSDAEIGRFHPEGPIIQPCMSGGLWDAGAGISVGGRHIANWLIGQVRDETQTEEKMLGYARSIGADETAVIEAFREVPAMSHSQFQRVAQMLFTMTNQLSTIAYQNIQQARFITERQHAEQALHESEERYHLIDEASQDLIYSYDRQSRFTHANSSMCRLMGLSSEQIVGKTHEELGFPPQQCDEWARLHQQVFATGATVISETMTPIQGGNPQYFEVVLNPIHAETGEIIGIAGTTRDINARKLAEARLAEQLEELRRWHNVTLGREGRILELKAEVNKLLAEAGKPPHYASAQEVSHE